MTAPTDAEILDWLERTIETPGVVYMMPGSVGCSTWAFLGNWLAQRLAGLARPRNYDAKGAQLARNPKKCLCRIRIIGRAVRGRRLAALPHGASG